MAASGRKTNWFAIWVSVAVVAVVVVVGIVVVAVNASSGGSGAAPSGSTIDSETGAIAIGDGEGDVELWFDFYCPHCQDFEEDYGPTIAGLVEAGDITLRVFPVALSGLNAASGTDFSARSASAAYCVASENPDATLPFVTLVFAQKPTGPGLTDEELAAIAEAAGAPGAASCIADGTYERFALSNARNIPPSPETGSAGTPTLLVGGEYVTPTGDPQADIVARLP